MITIPKDFLESCVNYVTSYIRDDPQVNRLLNGKQFTPAQIEIAVQIAIDRMHETAPIMLKTRPTDYPLHLILKAAVTNLFETANFVDSRNALQYSDGMLQIKDTHEELYTQLLQYLSSFLTELSTWKTQRNIVNSLTIMRQI